MLRPAENRGPRNDIQVRIVLVRPRNPLNIGAAARAMANFGFDDLVVVKPYAPVWRETVSAVGAERLVLQAKAVNSLDPAVGDCDLVIGTTALRNRKIERPLVRLPDLGAFFRRRALRRVAVLFGSEKTGLSNPYLGQCNVVVTVPTAVETPSMNLGQAVAVCCYELSRSVRRSLGPKSVKFDPAPAASADVKQLLRHALEAFEALGYLRDVGPEKRMEKVRRTLLQWKLYRHDVAVLHGMFRYILKTVKPEPSARAVAAG